MPVKKRRAWVAFILSLIVSGLGQLYNGQWKKAILFYGINLGMTILSLRVLIETFYGLLGSLAYAVVFVLFTCIEAAFQAVKTKEIVLTRYTRWYVYFLLWFINIFVNLYLISSISSYQSYKTSAGSMKPSLALGDYFIINKTFYQHHPIERGDIVVFAYPDDPSRDFVKRVIGLSNEKIELMNKEVFIDAQPLQENYIQHNSNDVLPSEYSPRDNFGPVIVPPDSIFLLGDNRDNSMDSRFWKNRYANINTIKGKVLYLYWSKDLSRIGLTVK